MRTIGRREFLKDLGAGAAMLSAAGGMGLLSCDPGRRLPNIVLVFIDDLGYADIGCFGASGWSTPNIDRLADEGIRFTDFYASQAVCSASRASLLTGCYAERVSILGALGPSATHGIHENEVTIAEMLKAKGYATAIYGKWHLGHHRKFLPLQHGFDDYLGIPYSNDMWPVDYDGRMLTVDDPGPRPWKLNYPQLPLVDGDETVQEIRTLADQATLTTRYTERAVKFIEENRSRPFFLYMPHSMVHVPLGVSEKYRGKSKQGMYGDTVMEIDWSVGEVMKTLKKHGLDDNTLIIFTSDNGPWINFGNHAGGVGPLRGAKGNMWEGGPRVPCVMRWPGRIPAGWISEKIAATIDILPTLAEITNAPLPENKIDGVSILPIIEGDSATPRDHFCYYYGRRLIAVRKREWKLVFPHQYRSYEGVSPGNDGYPGPYARGEAEQALYNLKTDIGETTDLSADFPDIVIEMTALANRIRNQLGDRLTGIEGSEVRQAGKLE